MKRYHPILDLETFISEHFWIDKALKKYKFTNLGSRKIPDDLFECLLDRQARNLFAFNMKSRVAFAKALHGDLGKFVENRRQKEKYHFITLSPASFALSISEAHQFDVKKLIRWVKRSLPECHYIGCVEAGFYGNLDRVGLAKEATISWHVHVIAWGSDELEMIKSRRQVNRGSARLIPGIAPAHVHHFGRDAILKRVFYMTKTVCREHSVYPAKVEQVDAKTGELIKVSTGTFKQKKARIRPGNAVTMMRIMGRRTILELTFSRGQGAFILQRAQERAMRRLSRNDEKRRRKLRCLMEGVAP